MSYNMNLQIELSAAIILTFSVLVYLYTCIRIAITPPPVETDTGDTIRLACIPDFVAALQNSSLVSSSPSSHVPTDRGLESLPSERSLGMSVTGTSTTSALSAIQQQSV
jgi:hypothetical protein